MSDPVSKSGDTPSVNPDLQDHANSTQPFLRMQPRHFFSNKFDMDVVEDFRTVEADDDSGEQPTWLNRMLQINLLLMILLIGVPVLLYCIAASAK
ncbi:hypothetical protein U1707_11090 [Sphingomonas sp. PB2P12]|uniref:hypothetical protein n=1 Tax=Sphingomonas sandaracina TaxID=3096157 RepID=UPI002FCC832D